MSDPGALLSKDLAEAVAEMVAEWEKGRFYAPPQRVLRDLGQAPPRRVILLQDLPSEGQADAAVTVPFADSAIQKVTILGNASSGTFTLGFQGQSTDALPWNASPAKVQAALAKLSAIGANNVQVTLGNTSYTNSANGQTNTRNPQEWIVSFIGSFARQAAANIPLLTFTSALGGTSPVMLITAKTVWGDSGQVITVNAVIPVGVPTPMRNGAVAVAIFFPGLGYGVIACEPRQFPQYY